MNSEAARGSSASPKLALRIPDRLRQQLDGFRKRVWTQKMSEAVLFAVFAAVAVFILFFAIERVVETPESGRFGLLLLALAGFALYLPWAFYRWVVRHREPEQLSQLLARKDPAFGDRLLGVFELARDEVAQSRSMRLCEAAIEQVDEDARNRDFTHAVPDSRIKRWGTWCALGVSLIVVGAFFIPAAMSNALARLSQPFQDIPRYTFAQFDELEAEKVVPLGEPFSLEARLAADSFWKPEEATAEMGSLRPLRATFEDGVYRFQIPPQLEATPIVVRCGDDREQIQIKPVMRPCAVSMKGAIELPEYLERPDVETRELRGGGLTVLQGSDVDVQIEMSRPLRRLTVDGEDGDFQDALITRQFEDLRETESFEMTWVDELGMAGEKPLGVTIRTREDAPPSIVPEGLPREQVLLATETISFQVNAQDDYGIREIGMVWEGSGHSELGSEPARGEKVIMPGGPERSGLNAEAFFGGKALGIEPQVVQLRLYVEDYLPGRERVYSPKCTIFLLSPDEHKQWITEQLAMWQKQALEVRDRELQLHELNKELRSLPTADLDLPDVRDEIERQAVAEKRNGDRLSELTKAGDRLIASAVKNEEFGVGTLEKWAEKLQILEDIANNRMPSVADLLKDASREEKSSSLAQSSKPEASAPRVAVNKSDNASPSGESEEDSEESDPPPAIPAISDVESRFDTDDEKPSSSSGSSPPPRFTLPQTVIQGGGPEQEEGESCPAGDKMEEAVTEQKELLDEFAKVADELEQILRDLENSTFVKRLKAQARLQRNVADDLSENLTSTFGQRRDSFDEDVRATLTSASDRQTVCSEKLTVIQQDMLAFQERRKEAKYQKVLEEMKDQEVVSCLETLASDLKRHDGLGVAESEFWADTLDRWAEELVGPG